MRTYTCIYTYKSLMFLKGMFPVTDYRCLVPF